MASSSAQSYISEEERGFASAIQRSNPATARSNVSLVEHFLDVLGSLKGNSLQRIVLEMSEDSGTFQRQFGVSLDEVSSLLSRWAHSYARHFHKELFPETSLSVFFGFNTGSQYFSRYQTSDFVDDLSRADSLLKEVSFAANVDLSQVEEEGDKLEAVVPQVEVTEEPEPANKTAVVIPPTTPVSQSDTREEQAGDSESSSPPNVIPGLAGPTPPSSLSELARGDVAIRHEIVRLQQLISRQMAEAYGVQGTAQDGFANQLAGDLTPFITYEMMRLGAEGLAEALRSPGIRYKIYLSVMLRAQQSPQFQATLQQVVGRFVPEGQDLSEDEIAQVLHQQQLEAQQLQAADTVRLVDDAGGGVGIHAVDTSGTSTDVVPSPEQVETGSQLRDVEEVNAAQRVQTQGARPTTFEPVSSSDSQSFAGEVGAAAAALSGSFTTKQELFAQKIRSATPEQIARMVQEADLRSPSSLTSEDMDAIAHVMSRSSASVESELRTLLSAGELKLTESQISGILQRLQAYGLTRKGIDAVNSDDLSRVLIEGLQAQLGDDAPFVLERLQTIFAQKGVPWQNTFSAYVTSVKQEIYLRSGNSAVLFSDPRLDPSERLVNLAVTEIQKNGGYIPVGLGLYVPLSVLQQQLDALNNGQPVPTVAELMGRKAYIQWRQGVMLNSSVMGLAMARQPGSRSDIEKALWGKDREKSNLLETLRLEMSSFKATMGSHGFTKETYQELHWMQTQQYLQQLISEQILQQTEVYELYQEFYIAEPVFLFDIGEDGYFYSSDGSPVYEIADTVGGDGPIAGGSRGGGSGGGGRFRAGSRGLATRVGGGKSSSLLNKASEAKKRQVAQLALMAALALIPGGAALLPFMKTFFVVSEKMRNLPIVGKWIGNKLDNFGWDSAKKVAKVGLIGAAAVAGAGLAASLAAFLAAAKLLSAILGPSIALGISLGQALGAGLAKIALGAKSLVSSLLGTGSSLASGLAGGAGSLLGGLTSLGIGWLTVPMAIGALTIFVSAFYLDQHYLLSSLLTQRQPIALYGSSPFGLGVSSPGCWPTNGVVGGIEAYCSDGSAHAVWQGCLLNIKGTQVCNGSAVDIMASAGQAVYSPFNGEATFYPLGSGLDVKYGNHVMLKAENGLVFIFAHLNDFGSYNGYQGQTVTVQPGAVIGTVDSTGNSTGNHLHYEVVGASIRSVTPEDPTCGMSVVSSCSGGP